ncbi:MAG TPA: enoyl-CoA hydratase/isomerase family protein, partial [Polyangiaceae bacterium]|nr:enoyl-CoA hydratase/isomerase family protein [Polyangiaceae bacterium]
MSDRAKDEEPMPSVLLIEEQGPVTTLTLNRPDKLNALNHELITELVARFREMTRRPPRAVVVTGAGKAFSAGVDIGEMGKMTTAEAKARADHGHELAALIETLACPVIAAVN